VHPGRSFTDAFAAKALPLTGRATAVTPPTLAAAQVFPQHSTTLAVCGNVLIDALGADLHMLGAGNLFGTPVFTQSRFDPLPCCSVDTRTAAGDMTTRDALPVGMLVVIVAIVHGIAGQLPLDGAGVSIHDPTDVTKRKACVAQAMDLVPFLTVQVRVTHVQLHLPVKRRRLPHLDHFSRVGVALRC